MRETYSHDRDSLTEEKYFPFMESEGFDRRYAILEIATERTEDGKYYQGNVFDTISKNIVWSASGFPNEDIAFERADEVLVRLEIIQGFGSISLQKDKASYDDSY